MARRGGKTKVVLKGHGLADYRKKILDHGVAAATEIAAEAVPQINAALWSAYDSGRTVYGDARPRGSTGDELTLLDTGDTRASLAFDNEGTVLRIKLQYPYVRFLIGKYKILPCGPTTALPIAWRDILNRITDEVLFRREKVA